MEQFENIIAYLKDLAVNYGIKVVGAIIVLIIGLWIISGLTRFIVKAMTRRKVDESLRGFLKSLFNILLKIMLIITVAAMIGIEMTSFIAILGAAGLAVGLALSGTLQNFAGGVMILLFKPFKVGDYIEAQGYSGIVGQIQIFNTILKTLDNKTIIIPNGGLSTGSMVNYSTEPQRRVDMTFGIAYGNDTVKAKKVIMSLIEADNRILKDPEPFVALSELASSSVNFVVRVWVDAADYWDVYFDMHNNIYNTFNKEGLKIPFPQMDVHLHQSK